MSEELYPIKGYEGLYSITKSGKVWSHLKSSRNPNGGWITTKKVDWYPRVNLIKDNKMHTIFIHRLVAETFISNPENKPYINHINGKKDCNLLENLEWCTRAENNRHAFTTGLKNGNHLRKLSKEGIDFILNNKGVLSKRKIAKVLGVSHNVVLDFLAGHTYKEFQR